VNNELRKHVESIFGSLESNVRRRLSDDLEDLERSVRQVGGR
jgi:hypothetical protein